MNEAKRKVRYNNLKPPISKKPKSEATASIKAKVVAVDDELPPNLKTFKSYGVKLDNIGNAAITLNNEKKNSICNNGGLQKRSPSKTLEGGKATVAIVTLGREDATSHSDITSAGKSITESSILVINIDAQKRSSIKTLDDRRSAFAAAAAVAAFEDSSNILEEENSVLTAASFTADLENNNSILNEKKSAATAAEVLSIEFENSENGLGIQKRSSIKTLDDKKLVSTAAAIVVSLDDDTLSESDVGHSKS